MGRHALPPASNDAAPHNPLAEAKRKHAIATRLAIASGAIHACAVHRTGIYRGDCPEEQAIRFAAEAYDREPLSDVFGSREELLDFVRDVMREHDRDDCLICHNSMAA